MEEEEDMKMCTGSKQATKSKKSQRGKEGKESGRGKPNTKIKNRDMKIA